MKLVCLLRTIAYRIIFPVSMLIGSVAHAVPFLPGDPLVPDSQLQQCITETAIANGWSDTNEITSLSCAGRSVRDIFGVEIFFNLSQIDLSDNKLYSVAPLAALNQITHLNLSGNRFLQQQEILNILAINPGISHLYLSEIKMGDDLFWLPPRGFAGEYDLVELDISYTGSLFDLYPLSQYINLKTLKLAGTDIWDTWPLDQLYQLEVLDLSENALTNIDSLMFLNNLTSLNISNNVSEPGIDLINVQSINNILYANPNMSRLGLAGIRITDLNQLNIFSTFAVNITELDISNTDISDIFAISNLVNLNVFKASNNNITGLVDSLAFLPIRELDLSHNKIDGFIQLDGFNVLESLDVSNNDLRGTDFIQPLSNLRSLNIGNNKLLDYDDVVALMTNPLNSVHLREIGVSGINLSNDLTWLPRNAVGGYSLTSLDISNTGVRDLAGLFEVTTLKSLNAADNNIFHVYELQNLVSLQELDLSNNNLTDIFPLTFHNGLTTLRLSGNKNIHPDEARTLVMNNPGLTRLGLADINFAGDLWWLPMPSGFGDYDLVELDLSNVGLFDAYVATQYSELRILKLAGNELNYLWGIELLADLNVLDLSNNFVSDIYPLHVLQHLQTLNISNNKPMPDMQGIDVTTLSQVLGGMLKLEYLGIAGINIGDLNSLNIQPLLAMNLLELDVSNTGISDISMLGMFTRLQDLKASNNTVSYVSGLELLSLQSLDLSNNNLQVISGVLPADISALDLSSNNLLDIFALQNLSQLQQLNLSGNGQLVAQDVINVVLNNRQLSSLGVASINFNDLYWLPAKTPVGEYNLVELDVSNTGSYFDLGPVAQYDDLQVLKAASNAIVTTSGLDQLINLRVLDLNNNQLFDVWSMQGMNQLQQLNLGGNTKLYSADIINIVNANPGLTHLNISGITGFNDLWWLPAAVPDGAFNFVELDLSNIGPLYDMAGITNHPGLKKLNLAGNGLFDPYPLNVLQELEVLDLSNNDLFTVQPLMNLFAITSADLSGNNLLQCEELDQLQMFYESKYPPAVLVRPDTCVLFTPPDISILTPLDGAIHFSTEPVNFHAISYDAEDGSLDAQVQWSSNIDGQLGSGALLSRILSAGNQVVTAAVTDSHGNTKATSVNLFVELNNVPTINIYSVMPGAIYEEGEAILLSAEAIDIEEGNISQNINWSSDLDGMLGTGQNIAPVLSVGMHTVTATVTDSVAASASSTVTLTVNAKPLLNIVAPVSGALLQQGDLLTLSASATDAEDGDLANSIIWSSNIDGLLGTGGSLQRSVSAGSHAITATVTDSQGSSVSQTVQLIVNAAPVLSVQSPVSDVVIQQGEQLLLSGTASDLEDGDLSASISWSSDKDGVLGTGASVTAQLSTGAHTITATVQDSHSVTKTSAVTVIVNVAPVLNIASPLDGSVFQVNQQIIVEGSAIDSEDGDLSTQIGWALTYGGVTEQYSTGITSMSLVTPGSYQLTAKVTDSHGATVTKTVQFTINAAPSVTIVLPYSGAIIQQGDVVTLSATASDSEDGDISTSISWSSDKDGLLGAGSNVSTQLSTGTHSITASVTDSNGATGSRTKFVTVNAAPTLTIGSPVSGVVIQQGEQLLISGVASDAEDGDLSASISWSSDKDGVLGTGASVTAQLSSGAHTVTATVQDSQSGAKTAVITVTINAAPVLSITAPITGVWIQQGDSIILSAVASDSEDGYISSAIDWSSDRDGVLGTGGALNTQLSAGTHMITAKIQDSYSAVKTSVITVNVNASPVLNVASPLSGAVVQLGELINLEATAVDSEDGNISANIAWGSSIDGNLGSGASLSSQLSAGTHQITATITDSHGAVVTKSVNIVVNTAPVINLLSPVNGSLFMLQESVGMLASASDNEDGDISSTVSWNSSIDGVLGSGATISQTLSLGSHTITATVTDVHGGVASVSTTVLIEQIDLFITVKSRGSWKKAYLAWSGSRTDVDIYRNGIVIDQQDSDGEEDYRFGGQAVFKVCEVGTNYCSKEIMVE